MIGSLFAFFFVVLSSFFLVLTTIAFFRAKDVFTMTKIVMIGNFYVLPLMLLALYFQDLTAASCFKIVALILLNCTISCLLIHVMTKRTIADKIVPDETE